MKNLTLLGPQRLKPTLVKALDRLEVQGPVAAITAGWQEREGEDQELQTHLQRPVVDLLLHQRLEQAFAEDKELFDLHRARQDQLRAMQRLYRYRLDFVIEPARELMRRKDHSKLLMEEQKSAIEALRQLDAEHLGRITEVHREFNKNHDLLNRPVIRRHRLEIARILENSSALLVAGGHVAVLLNRLRAMGITKLLGDQPIVAWSAGAMVLSERIILFHDSPPQGAGNAEILEVGLGLYQGLVPLPHADQRLRLKDKIRASLLARRFAPDICAPLNPQISLTQQGSQWRSVEGGRWITREGNIEDMESIV